MGEITGFDPICAPGCRALILGSMPSVKSLEENMYYAHPRNAFWRIMCQLLRGEYIADYGARKEMLLAHGIALWDVCHCCERETSADSMIRNETPNDIAALVDKFNISVVLLNGGAAAALYRRHVKISLPATRLPSTSPAYTLPYAQKQAAWARALIDAGIDIISDAGGVT